ncbi:MAG: endonuclease/exonuclease/phosphatase family protein [Verrucomicrobiales bacterium]|nr:endonuclease/exonuclease/phosphatase family protein [Verrucomicrobiales bacterium]
MPEITDTPPPEIRAEHAALSAALTAGLPPKHVDNNLVIASWNIRGFGDLTKKWTADPGDTPKRDLRSLLYISEIVSRFDVIAIQEVKGNLRALRHMLRYLNRIDDVWSLILTDETRGDAGNNERLAFVFDTRRVRLSGLAAELVVPTDGEADLVAGFQNQFARTPYAVAFKARGRTFILVTLHVLFGADAAGRIPELQAIAAWLRSWAREVNSYNQNLITLGDFNLDLLGSQLANALFSTGLAVPPELQTQDRTIFGAGSEVRHADQIAWFPGGEGTPGLSSLTYNHAANVFNFEPLVLNGLGLTRMQKSFRVSDHLPLWAEFRT